MRLFLDARLFVVYNQDMLLFKKIALLLGCLAFCFITSCNFVSSVGAALLGTQSESDWSGSTTSIIYDGTQVQFELPNNVRTLNVQVNQPVDVFMAKMNFSSQTLLARSTRYIVSTNTLSAENQFASNSLNPESYRNLLSDLDSLEDVSGITSSGIIRKDFAPARDFVPPVLGGDVDKGGRFADESSFPYVSTPMKAVLPLKATVGSTQKNLWVDLPKSGSGSSLESKLVGTITYTKRPATLRATGTYCNIWVVNDYFTSATASGSKVDTDAAKKLATKFDDIYSKIRDVFGKESDKMIDTRGIVDISTVSDTGTKVNIVVYDIEGDYKSGQQSGTLGYFWAKDYYTTSSAQTSGDATIGLTNEGKYFYVDSYFLTAFPQMLYSTLAHEFQHMINFGEKTMNSMESATMQSEVLVSQTWSNEMMSMVCEDMIQQHLNIEDKDSPIARLPWLCQYYYLSGLTDWLSGNHVQISYAGAYAFGAYLARNYGGTQLIKEIATNNYVDQQAITQALKKLGKNETFELVFEKYVQALVLDNPSTTVPSFNKSVDGINGKMKAIDIFNVKTEDELGREHSVRPILLKPDANNRVDLRPYGFTLHKVGNTNSAGSLVLTFSSPVNSSEKVYLLIQPRKK